MVTDQTSAATVERRLTTPYDCPRIRVAGRNAQGPPGPGPAAASRQPQLSTPQLLLGGSAGAEPGHGPAVPGVGGMLANPGSHGGVVHGGGPPGTVRLAAVSSPTGFLAQASSMRSLPTTAMSAAAAALLRARGQAVGDPVAAGDGVT
jgi:hypothetical protein